MKQIKYLISLLLILFLCLLSCESESEFKTMTADVILIQAFGDYKYKIALNGYGIDYWYYSYIKVETHPLVTEGFPKAVFNVDSYGQVISTNDIKITFNNIAEAEETLKNIADINVYGNSNVTTSVNNESCFIKTAGGNL